MQEHPQLRIYRNLDINSKQSINKARAIFGNLEQPKKIIDYPRLSILGISGLTRATRSYSASKLNSLIHPLPESAEDCITLPVKGLRSHQGRKELPWLMIQLDDNEGIIKSEITSCRERVDKYVMKMPEVISHPPNLVLGRIAIEGLTMQLVEEIEDSLPKTITFQRISYPMYTPSNTPGQDSTPLAVRKGYVAKRQPIPDGLLIGMRTKS